MRDTQIIHGEHDPETDRIGAALVTPYHADFVEELKALVPSAERSWSPDDKVWWVSEEWADEAEKLVLFHFGTVRVMDEDGVEEWRSRDGTVARQEGLF